MQLCKYANLLGCKDCTEIFHLNCKKFRQAHSAWLINDLQPFRYTKTKCVKDSIVWSDDENKIKSLCAISAINNNYKVKVLSLSQALSLALNSDDTFESSLVFISCSTKPNGDPEKISSCLKSFVEQLQFKGTLVYLYISKRTFLNFKEYKQI